MRNGTKHASLDLQIKQADLLYKQNLTGLLAILFNSIAFISVTSGNVSFSFLLPWFFILNASALLRYMAFHKWKKARLEIRSEQDLTFWFRFMYASLLVSGFSWGALGWISADGTPTQQILTGLIISSMSAGAMITYVASPIGMACVIAPAMLLWASGFLNSGLREHQVLAGLVLFYGGLMILVGRNLYSAVMKSLVMDARLQKSEERLRMSMDSSDSLTWDWDLTEKYFYWEGNVGLFPGGKAQLQEVLRSSLENLRELDSEIVIQDRHRHMSYVAIRGKFYRDQAGVPYRFAGICWDVTTKKNAEILRQERDLHEAANKAKSVILANASHELRTPLAAILGFSEALLRNFSLSEQGRRDAHAIFRQGNHMVSLVNDLLDLSKIESDGIYMQKAAMNPAQEIEDSISVIRKTLETKELNIVVVYEDLIPFSIQADCVRFRQVLINLLTNAVKYTSQGTISVRVCFTTDIENKGTFKIRVIDSGIGMNEETKAHLFEPFLRGEDPKVQRVQGSGLGLALSASIMKMMGGELTLLSSELGKGSTFEMSFKLGPAENLRLGVPPGKGLSPTPLLAKADGTFLKGRRVLVVDDSVDLRALMSRYLNRQGAAVETSENGAEAVEIAMRHPFDIILMDIKMPVMDGYEATAMLREQGYSKPIVALTAQASVDGKQKSDETGFDGYLSKPVDMVLLKKILKDKAEFV